MHKKKHILDSVEDLISNFLYYDRQDDEDLPRGEIEKLIKSGELTINELTEKFREELIKGVS